LECGALRLPALGGELVAIAGQIAAQRNVAKRAIEPLGAERRSEAGAAAAGPATSGGVALRFEGVSVVAAGHEILRDVTLDVAAGEHVAIVGKSGAGKSTLIALLLGGHRPSSGRVLADGEPVEGAVLETLRRGAAWVDPAVHLWNRALARNLAYGSGASPKRSAAELVEAADLRSLLQALPHGLQTVLGESGALVSGGEGQRVRLA